MKQIIVLICLTASIFTCQTSMAQSDGLSLRADIGVGLPSGVGTVTSVNNTITTVSPYSLGSGFNIAVGGYYMFSDHMGAGLDLNYMIGYNTTSTYKMGTPVTETYVSTGSLFAITPNVILSTNSGKINPYARFGIVIASASYQVKSTESSTGSSTGANIETYTGGMALGWYAGFGVQFPLSDKLKLNVELFDRDLSYAPTTDTNTQAYDGQQKKPTHTMVTNYDAAAGGNNEPTAYQPFGSVGFKVGIAMNIGSK